MKQEFDFNKTDKRTPYTVPEGFFDEMRQNILNETSATTLLRRISNPPRRTVHRERRAIIALCAAAVVAVLLVLTFTRKADTQPVGYGDVEQAFAQLDDADQNYIIEVYQNDIFLNE